MDLSSPYFPMMKQDTMDDGYDTSNYPGALYPGSYPMKPEPEEAYTHTIAEADSAGTQPDSSSTPKKRPKKKRNKLDNDDKYRTEPGDMHPSNKKMKQEKITETFKERKKVDRFNGMPEEEVAKRTLPDHLLPNLDIVIIGINPGLFAAYKGHHYAGPGNHFWKCLYLSGLIPEPMTSDDDYKLLEFGIGFTNMVARTTRGSADLPRKEIKEGAKILLEKLQKFQPKIAVFNGKGIYEVFSGKKNFDFGKQPDIIEGTNTIIFVMPSSSARCAQLPRAIDKVPFYEALKKLRDHLNGRLPNLSENEVTFPDVKLKIESDDGIKSEALDIKEDSEDGSPMMGFHSPDGGTNGTADGDKPKPSKKATKKKNAKKKKVEDEESNMSNQAGSGPVNHQQVQAQAPHQQQPPQLQYPQQGYPMGPAADPYSNLRVKSEKNDSMLYGYGQQGCPYGGYPSPQSQGASYYSGTHNPGHYGNYPPPPPAHQGAYMSSGSLNQLENFVDQIPNIGHPSMEYSAPRPQYVQGPLGYPPPPPAHEQQSHNGSLYPQSHAPPGIGYGYNAATPVPPSSPSYSPSQPYGADSYSQQRSPVYTDLDSVQVKQERIDPGYGGY